MVEMGGIEQTPGNYGYRVDPIGWLKLVDIIEKENNPEIFSNRGIDALSTTIAERMEVCL